MPTIEDINFSLINFESHCNYLKVDLDKNGYPVKCLTNIKKFCVKIVPFICYYKKQIDSYNKTVHNILMKEIPLILQNVSKNKKEKRGIPTLLVTGFIGLACKGISSYLHNK